MIVLRESVGIRRQNAALNFQLKPLFLRFQTCDFFAAMCDKFGIGRLGFQQRAILLKIGQGFEISLPLRRPAL